METKYDAAVVLTASAPVSVLKCLTGETLPPGDFLRRHFSPSQSPHANPETSHSNSIAIDTSCPFESSQRHRTIVVTDVFVIAINTDKEPNGYIKVDKERVQLVGPDCACAEWLLRNGASVRFKGHPEMLSDYNTLIALEESPEQKRLKVEDIHARGAHISVWGFDHLKNCNHVKKISLIFCNRITDSALFKLKYVEDTLQYLEITSCFNVKDEGVKSLAQLRNLTVLKLGDLVSVKNVEDCEADLKRGLPKCKIEFTKPN